MVQSTNGTSKETTSLTDQVRAQILCGIQSWSDQEVTKEDLLRVYRDQIALLFVTEQVRSAMAMDPFEHLRENIPSKVFEEIQNSIAVTNHHSVHTMEGYVRTEATVRVSPLSQRSKKRTAEHLGDLELHFQYTRPTIAPMRVTYTITMASSDQPPQPLLWIHVDALGAVPSHLPAICSEDGWSDMDDDENDDHPENCSDRDDSGPNGAPPEISKPEQKDPTTVRPTMPSSVNDVDEKADQYTAGMDPEVVSQLVDALRLGSSVNDITIFFWLMTFPFYEHEWDLVGYLLETVFDSSNDDEEEVILSAA